MKLAVFVLLLVVLPFQAEASSYVCDTLIVNVGAGVDLEGDGDVNEPDPYVKVTVDGKTKLTREIHNEEDPRWDQDLTFKNVKSDKLVLEIWEYDDFFHGADDHLRTCKEKITVGSYILQCGTASSGAVLYGVHCLKGDMKRQYLSDWKNMQVW